MARILLAEDYDDLRDMIAELLRSQEHVVEAYDNGLDAQASLKSHNFDLLILDWELPRLHGVEVIKEYRAGGGTTPVLLLSGKRTLSDKETGFDAGADDYLTKPFHPKELTARIKALLRRAELSAPRTAPPVDELTVGSVFAERYAVISSIAQGSTGTIYKARHSFLNRDVALKVLHPQLIADGENVARFKREAQAVSCLSHPNIIAVHDFGIVGNKLPYLVMDFCEGKTLTQHIQENNHLVPDDAIPLISQICDALAHAHSRGVIHRDVKPGNIIVTRTADGRDVVKLVDFGIAKVPHGGAAMQVTQNGEILGSPLYMSPEQCMGQPLDVRTDIYSLGCVVHFLLLGKEPFIGDNVLDTMYRRTVEDVKPFKATRPDLHVPTRLEQIVQKMLKRDRNKRYQSVDEIKSDLHQMQCQL